MHYQLRWTESSGSQLASVSTATAALKQYHDLEAAGCVQIEVRQDGGRKLSIRDLERLMLAETASP